VKLALLFQRKIQNATAPPDTAPIGSYLVQLVNGGRFQELDARDAGRAFREILSGGWFEIFGKALEQLEAALDKPATRRWALEATWALVNLDDLSLVPQGALPALRERVLRVLATEEDPDLAEGALEIVALMLGLEAVEGSLERVQEDLASLEGEGRGRAHAERIMASRNIAVRPLEWFFREEASPQAARVLPLFDYLGDPGAHTLTEFLEEEGSFKRRRRIMEILLHLGPLALPALKKSLVKGSWYLMRNALNLVADMGEAEAFEYVVPCLEHPDLRVLQAAVRAAEKTGANKAERFLVELLPNAAVERQLELLQGLGQIKASGAIPTIEPLTAKGPESVRVKALETLGQIGDASALPILATVLKRKGRIFRTAEPLPIRMASAKALAAFGTAEARHILEQILNLEPKGENRIALLRGIEGVPRRPS